MRLKYLFFVVSEMDIERAQSVCFTGHRNIPADEAENLKSLLKSTIEIYIRRDFKFFITGGAVGFDSMAAECISQLKQEGYDIYHILALPCRDQTIRWNDLSDLTFYKRMLGAADEVIYTSAMYSKGCMHTRNRFMVDNSSVCIAYRTSEKGGTAYTCKYAKKEGLQIVNLGGIVTQLEFC